MKISVVIPSYNRRDLLRECLHSMQAQRYPVDEIVVVDDGSTDETDAMVRSEFPSVRYLRITNSGVVIARIAGIEHARHDWIALCDSDDLWEPDFLATRVNLLQQQPQCLYSFGNFRVYTDGRIATRTKFEDAPAEFWKEFGQVHPTGAALVAVRPPYASLLRFQPVFPSTVLMHRSFYEQIGGFDSRLSRTMSEDFEFTLRCAEHAPLLVDCSANVLIRKHANNSSGDVGRMLVGDIGILKFARSHHRSATRHASIVDDEISSRSRQATDVFFCAGDVTNFRALAGEVQPQHQSFKWKIKRMIGAAPRPVANKAMRWLA